MNYPFWDAAVGYGPLMASIAILHVFISHFAIGGGLYLVVQEHLARRRGDAEQIDYLIDLSRFFLLTTLVLGALTGVGIWFVIGLLNPGATELLIHNFVWGWAIEWTFFAVEILAAILYYYGWKQMEPRVHLTLGWIYFAAAWLSLAVIDGILSFMLTPGRWLQSGDFWDGFLNPGYLSSLALRTGVCVLLAGLYALLIASRRRADALKARLARTNALWALAGMAIAVPSFLWFRSTLPASLLDTARAAMPWTMLWYGRLGWIAILLAGAIVLLALLPGRRHHPAGAVVLMILGLAWFGSFEFLRESIRKPWIVTDTMYGNGVEVAQLAVQQRDGMLAHLAYRTGDDGRDLFLHACRSCHTLNGYKALRPAFDGTDAPFIAGVIRGADKVRGQMPPFAGTAAETNLLAAWLAERMDRRPIGEIYGLQGSALGAKACAVRCGKCHVPGGYRDMSSSLAGMSRDEIADFLDSAGELSDQMPPYTGAGAERDALIDYLGKLSTPRSGGTQ